MSGKFSPEALDLTLKDLIQNDEPCGGICVLISADWRQGPVVKFGTESEVVDNACLSSHLWKHVNRFRLTKSLRDREDLPYAKTALDIGEGAIKPIELEDGTDVIPLSHTISNADSSQLTCSIKGTTDFGGLDDTIYPDFLTTDHSSYND